MTTISADLVALSRYAGQQEGRARELDSLARKLRDTDFGLTSGWTGSAEGYRDEAVAHLQQAASSLRVTADRTAAFVSQMYLAEARMSSLFAGLGFGAFLAAPIYNPGQVLETSDMAGTLGIGFTFVDAEAGITYVRRELPDGRIEVTVLDTAGVGLSAEAGAAGHVGSHEIGGAIGASILGSAGDGFVYNIDPKDLKLVLAAEASRHALGYLPDWDRLPKPVATISREGLEAGGEVTIIWSNKGIDASAMRSVRTERNGTTTTTISMDGTAAMALFGKVDGMVGAKVSVTRDKKGNLLAVEVVHTKAASVGLTGEREHGGDGADGGKDDGGRKVKGTAGGGKIFTTTVSERIDVAHNRALADSINGLADDPLLNFGDLRQVAADLGVTTTRKSETVFVQAGAGGKVAAGAKLELNVDVAGTKTTVVDVQSSDPTN